MSPDDATLLNRWTAQGDAEAFNAIVDRFADQVYATCHRILRNDADAEDVAQECFLHLVRAGGDVRASLGGWLHRAATTKSLDRIRRDASRRKREQAYGETAESVGEMSSAEWDEIQRHIDEAIETLPEETRHAIVAHFLGRKSHAEVAQELHVSRRAVSYRIERGLDAIRRELNRRGVVVTGASLGSALAMEASAAPLSLKASLGKLAIAAGTGPGAAIVAGNLVGGLTVMKANVVVFVTAILTLVACVYLVFERPEPAARVAAAMPADVEAFLPQTPALPRIEPAGRSVTRSETAPRLATEEPSLEVLLALSRAELQRARQLYPLIKDPDLYASVSGIVLDSDGYALSGVQVFLVPMNQWGKLPRVEELIWTTASAADGTYEISGIDHAGLYWVSASLPGYTVHPGKPMPGTDVELTSGSWKTGIDFTMQPGVQVSGVVVSGLGEPVPGATIFSLEFTFEHDKRRTMAFDEGRVAQTDAAGGFAMVFGEEYRGYVASLRVVSDVGDSTFPIVWIQDKEAVELQLAPQAIIRGRVQATSDERVQDAHVRLYGSKIVSEPMNSLQPWSHAAGAGGFLAVCDAGGYFAVEVDSGLDFEAELVVDSSNGNREREKIAALDAGEIREFNPLIVRSAAAVRAHAAETASGKRFNRPFLIEAVALVDDKVVAVGESAGPSSARIELPAVGSRYAFQARYKFSPTVLGERSKLYEVFAGEEIEVTLTLPDPQEFSLRVLDDTGNPIEGAQVTVSAEFHGVGHGEKTNIHGQLSYPIFVEPNCKARLKVEKPGYISSWGKTYSDQRPGTVHPEETIVLYASAGFEGNVTDATGVGLVNIPLQITLTNQHGQSWPLEARTDATGHFTIVDQAPAGVVDILIETPQPAERQEFQVVTESGTETLSLPGPAPDAPLGLTPGTRTIEQVQLEANAITDLGEISIE